MKVAILAGGLGTRLAEETEVVPKPMVEIGGLPILWHIMQCYSHFGFNEFVVALGYKGDVIKRFFLDYQALNGNLTVDLASGKVDVHRREARDWKVSLIETGPLTNTGGRVKRLQPWLGSSTFLLTYGDGVCNLDVRRLVEFHRTHGRAATITAVRPPARFGGLTFDGDVVTQFTEKPQIGEGWINGGFMVLDPDIFNYLPSDDTSLESHALEQMAADGKLMAYRHNGFWQCMDTLRDKRQLQAAWQQGQAPWKVWG